MRMIVDSNDLPSKLDARILPQLVCVLLLCVANALAVGPSSDQSRCPDGLTTSSAVWGQDTVPVPVLVPVPNIPYLPILPLGHNVTCQGQALQPVQGKIYMLVPPRGQLQSYLLVPFLGSCDSLPPHTTNVAPSSLEQGLIPQLVSPGPVQQFFVANSQVLMQNSTLCRNDRSAVLSPPGRESQASSNPGQDPNASAKLSTQDAAGLDDLVYKNPSLFPRQPAPVSPVSQQSDRQSVGKIRKGKIRKGQSQKGQSQKRQIQKKIKLRPRAVAEYYRLKRAYSLPTEAGKLTKVHFGPLDTFNVQKTKGAGPSSQCVR